MRSWGSEPKIPQPSSDSRFVAIHSKHNEHSEHDIICCTWYTLAATLYPFLGGTTVHACELGDDQLRQGARVARRHPRHVARLPRDRSQRWRRATQARQQWVRGHGALHAGLGRRCSINPDGLTSHGIRRPEELCSLGPLRVQGCSSAIPLGCTAYESSANTRFAHYCLMPVSKYQRRGEDAVSGRINPHALGIQSCRQAKSRLKPSPTWRFRSDPPLRDDHSREGKVELLHVISIGCDLGSPPAQRRKGLWEPFHALFYPRGVMRIVVWNNNATRGLINTPLHTSGR